MRKMTEPAQTTADVEARFSESIRVWRDLNGLTLADACKRFAEVGLKLDPSALSRLENGNRAIRLNEAVAMAAGSGQNLTDLVEGVVHATNRDELERLLQELGAVTAEVEMAQRRADEALYLLDARRNTQRMLKAQLDALRDNPPGRRSASGPMRVTVASEKEAATTAAELDAADVGPYEITVATKEEAERGRLADRGRGFRQEEIDAALAERKSKS